MIFAHFHYHATNFSQTGKFSYQVFPLRTGKTWKRQDFLLEDPTTKTKIGCKLWGQHADRVTTADAGASVSLTNVEVDIYNNKTSIKSTDLTMVKIHESMAASGGRHMVLGVDEDEDHITLITETGEELVVQADLIAEMNMSVEEFTNKTPIQDTATTDKGKMTTDKGKMIKVELDSDTE
ncbi:hypothetical protein BSL78_20472 [Apostichopus japonicus]|uniref:Uncharacterized protein n=1 Tax=Stichopus japonicus TaxID=307972 RepID=A0A2G8K3Y6_STIJA|nr:hypothetical protein BSL78_20472 [Apostichopus japonicus]